MYLFLLLLPWRAAAERLGAPCTRVVVHYAKCLNAAFVPLAATTRTDRPPIAYT